MESIARHTGHPEYFSTATVITANPATLTCDILKTKGGMLYGVPVLNTTGGIQTNDVSWSSNLCGAVVFYTYIDGQPYIMGTVPVAAKPSVPTSTSSTSTGSGGDNALTYGATDRDSYACGRSSSYMPGDKVFSTDGGAELALLSEGGIVLKASPMSQIIMGALMDFVKIVARELTISTDFGDISFSHGSSGRTGMSIVGGAKYGDEAQPGSGTPTAHLYMGDTPDAPDSRFGVRVNSVDGGDYGAIVMGTDGKLVLATSQDALLSVGKNNEVRVLGDDYYQVDGKRAVEVGDDETRSIFGKFDFTVGNRENHSVGSDLDLQVGGALRVGAESITLVSRSNATGPVDVTCSALNIRKA